MIAKEITYFRQRIIVACDEKCEKAWGKNCRPVIQLSENEDDYAFLADSELGVAPVNPGTCEGNDVKPIEKEERLNKWCCRECERCRRGSPGESFTLPDFNSRVYNIKNREV